MLNSEQCIALNASYASWQTDASVCPIQRDTMNYQRFFADALSRLKEEHRYRSCADIERTAGQFPHAVWHSPQGDRNITIWCSNDYLGMGQHPKLFTILEAVSKVVE